MDVLSVRVDSVTMDAAVARCLELIADGNGAYVVTANPEIIIGCRSDAALRDAVEAADLVVADGHGVVWAAGVLACRGKVATGDRKTSLPAVVPGIELAERLLETVGSVYLFGAKPGAAERAAARLTARYSSLQVAGVRDGYSGTAAEDEVIADIQRGKPDLTVVCLGSPKQERFMRRCRDSGVRTLLIGLGGSIDVWSGDVPRAPRFWRKLGLEWLWRTVRFRRWSRLRALMRFALKVALNQESGGQLC